MLLKHYNGIPQFACGNEYSIYQAAMILGCLDKRIMKIVDCHGVETLFFKSTLSVCIKGACPEGCVVPEDYRASADAGMPHLVIHGFIHNCNMTSEYRSMTLWPPKGMTIEIFYCQVIKLLNCEPSIISMDDDLTNLDNIQSQVINYCFPSFTGQELTLSDIIPADVLADEKNNIALVIVNGKPYAEGVEYTSNYPDTITFNEEKGDCYVCILINQQV